MTDKLNEGFQNESLGSTKKAYKDNVNYLGDLRIIGQIIENHRIIGYVIMQERTKQFKPYTVQQTEQLLRKFKFVNAEYNERCNPSEPAVRGTENSINRILRFNSKMQPIDNLSIMVLAEVHINGKFEKYQVLDPTGKIIEVTQEVLIKAMKNGTDVVNAKLINKNGKEYLSANRAAFTIINRTIAEDKNAKKQEVHEIPDGLKPADKWRHKKHIEKLMYSTLPKYFIHVLKGIKRGAVLERDFIKMNETYKTKYNSSRAKINTKKEVQIICKEIIPNLLTTEKQKSQFKTFWDIHSYRIKNLTCTPEDFKDWELWFGLAQVTMLIPSNREKLLNNKILKTTLLNNAFDDLIYDNDIDEFIANEYMISEFEECLIEIRKELQSRYEYKQKKLEGRPIFDTYRFTSAEDAAQLGFAISERMDGYKYTTKDGRKLTLKYIGKYIPYFEELKPLANCLGDLLLIANAEKYWSYDNYYINNGEFDIKPEMSLGILALYNPEICKKYIELRKDSYEPLADMLPGFDFDNPVDYRLPDSLRLYYESGCNVYYNDIDFLESFNEHIKLERRYDKNNIKNSNIINYRPMGVKKNIRHLDLYNDLAPILNMITSDLCTAEKIEEYIGQLRAL